MKYVVKEQVIVEIIPSGFIIDNDYEPMIKEIRETDLCTFHSKKHFNQGELLHWQKKYYLITQAVRISIKDKDHHVVLYVKECRWIPFNRIIYNVETDTKKLL